MDIVIAPGQLLATATLIDVAITAVTAPSVPGTITAREKAKHTKYGSLCDTPQTLVPVVFSPLGSVNAAGAEILGKICAASASRENAMRAAFGAGRRGGAQPVPGSSRWSFHTTA
jgi:hypothetical protein